VSEFVRSWFVLAGILYYLDADADMPRLFREVKGERPVEVATFGQSWSPYEVLETARADRAGLPVP
jgi:hypothetical protein